MIFKIAPQPMPFLFKNIYRAFSAKSTGELVITIMGTTGEMKRSMVQFNLSIMPSKEKNAMWHQRMVLVYCILLEHITVNKILLGYSTGKY